MDGTISRSRKHSIRPTRSGIRIGWPRKADLRLTSGCCPPLRDPGLVPAAIANALGVREIGQQDIWSSLLLHLQDRRLLLALDNFEQIVDAAPLVGELLLACPHLTFLVTSRMALNLRAGDDNRAIDLLKDALALRWQLRVRPDSADSVELLALVAVRNGQTRHAVRLFAGADAARSAAEAVAPPIERALVAEAIQSLRSDLGGAAFMEIWTSDTAVTLETLVPEALNLELPNPLPKTG